MSGQFTTVRSLGGLLPPDLLGRVQSGDASLPGMTAEAYHLLAGEGLREAISRSWNRLLGAWRVFQTARSRLDANAPGTTVTRERWLLVLFSELGYGRLPAARGLTAGGVDYPISHAYGTVPVHLVGARVGLDRRVAGLAGAARSSPHALVQEFLNRSDDHLWGFVSNGLVLRLLRDNRAISRQAFAEFDLEGMMDGEVYAEFVLLWLLCHQSRVEGDRPERCILQQWVEAAEKEGTRALESLRGGVERALRVLGTGFLAHPENAALRDRLSSGGLSPQELYRQLLRVVYRLLFLFVAEDRDVLLLPSAEGGPARAVARERYQAYYSTRRVRDLARRRLGSKHDDLWRMLSLVVEALGSDAGCAGLALPGLNGQLFSAVMTPDLSGARLRNEHLLEAVRALAWVERDGIVRAVDYRNLGAEELGSVYESLLELHPRPSVVERRFTLEAGAGSERKTTGSYYTPASLITQLLETALDPVLDRAAGAADPQAAILALRVCDPACGSGHFLVAAAHRIARRLAAVRTGEAEPAPEAVQLALRDVVSRCIYGVDVNPMALELAKVNLWIEAHVSDQPLTFLDHHLRGGNSLLGATAVLIEAGIPDAAFKAIEGDDRLACASARKRNRELRDGQGLLFTGDAVPIPYDTLAARSASITAMEDGDLAALHAKEAAFEAWQASPEQRRAWAIADAFCAAFTARKIVGQTGPYETFSVLRDQPELGGVPGQEAVAEQAERYRFFHWHLAYPDVFEERGGFDVVLGNPPWERVKLQEKEFFFSRSEEIAGAPNAAARRKLIQRLAKNNDPLHGDFVAAKRDAEAASHLIRDSGRFPLCGVGDVNTYAVFAELNRQNLAPTGRAGFIVPTGIATDHTTRHFFADLVATRTLHSLLSFENEAHLFVDVDHRVTFTLVTITGQGDPVPAAEFFTRARDTADLLDPERRYALSAADIRLINPNTLTAPVFRFARDATLAARIYRRVPVLLRENDPDGNPWGLSFMRMLDMSNDSGLFRTQGQLEEQGWALEGNIFVRGDERCLPLYEAKMLHHFDHRYGTYERQSQAQANVGTLPRLDDAQHDDPHRTVLPRYWVPEPEVSTRLANRWTRHWLLGWRDICRNTDQRTVIAAVFPLAGVGNKVPLMLPREMTAEQAACLACNLSGLVHDYAARQKIGGTTLNFFIFWQFPVLPPAVYAAPAPWHPSLTLGGWIAPRHAELTYTAWDLESFAADIGFGGPPFRWDPERRLLLRCELDAAFFHLYGLDRDDAAYVMDAFPIVRAKDEKAHGDYRAKRVILDIYDDLAKAAASTDPYPTRLIPPPADPSQRHTPR